MTKLILASALALLSMPAFADTCRVTVSSEHSVFSPRFLRETTVGGDFLRRLLTEFQDLHTREQTAALTELADCVEFVLPKGEASGQDKVSACHEKIRAQAEGSYEFFAQNLDLSDLNGRVARSIRSSHEELAKYYPELVPSFEEATKVFNGESKNPAELSALIKQIITRTLPLVQPIALRLSEEPIALEIGKGNRDVSSGGHQHTYNLRTGFLRSPDPVSDTIRVENLFETGPAKPRMKVLGRLSLEEDDEEDRVVLRIKMDPKVTGAQGSRTVDLTNTTLTNLTLYKRETPRGQAKVTVSASCED
jgi:hypothetical protein